ncbi:MAG: hypothetical protein ACLTKE_03940 [Coprococcus sp.]
MKKDISIADCVVEYEPMYALLQEKMEKYRFEDETEQAADISLRLMGGFLRERQKENPLLDYLTKEYIWAGLVVFIENCLNS